MPRRTTAVLLSILNSNDAPNGVEDIAYVPMNGSGHRIDVLANDSDPDGDTIHVSLPTTTTAHGGTLALVDNNTRGHLSTGDKFLR